MISMTIVENYLCSLLAKPFVILTGSSGTGKTRLAIQFAEAVNKKTKNSTTLEVKVNKDGKILDKNEDEIKMFCKDSNQFEAIINDGSYSNNPFEDDRFGEDEFNEPKFIIKITMCSYVESDDAIFKLAQLTKPEVILYISKIENKEIKEKNYELVPVGADWTDVRYLLGYTNPFGEGGKKTYEITETLKILLRALHSENKYKPFFLILDEMNLSHVERYFSTFLSVMEANKSALESRTLISKKELKLISEVLQENSELTKELEAAQELLIKNKGVFLPQNLFIVGTINVDETTYMFSPKVLDRAHVMELETQNPHDYFELLNLNQSDDRISFESNKINEILQLFEDSINVREAGSHNPLTLIKQSILDEAQQKEIIEGVQKVMNGIYILLDPCGFSYGYRIINEVLDYICYSIKFLKSDNWEEILDGAILQKVLPKIHGNRRQLSDCLNAINTFFDGHEASYVYGKKTITAEATNIQLISSRKKIEKMIEVLNYTGYTSFIS